ncbi:hypothetical protein ACTFIY_008316 [Dictyostelium cf. discoideum]
MVKRNNNNNNNHNNNNNSINNEINKIIPIQTTKDLNSKREKEIYVQIKKINSNRSFVYKNIQRHLLLALESFGSLNNLFLVLSDCLATLKDYDYQENQLQLKLQTIYNSTTATTTTTTSASNSKIGTASTGPTIATSKIATSNNVISNIENNTNKSPPSSKSSNSFPSTSSSKRVPKSKTRVTKKSNQVISNSSSGVTENVTTTSTATTDTADTTDTTDSTNTTTSNTSSDDTAEQIKKRGRPSKIQPDSCYVCRRTLTSYWRKGIFNDQNEDLCNPCGLNYLKKGKKEQISKNQNSIHNILN